MVFLSQSESVQKFHHLGQTHLGLNFSWRNRKRCAFRLACSADALKCAGAAAAAAKWEGKVPKTAEQIKIYYLQQNEALWVKKPKKRMENATEMPASAVELLRCRKSARLAKSVFFACNSRSDVDAERRRLKVAAEAAAGARPTGLFGRALAIMWHAAASGTGGAPRQQHCSVKWAAARVGGVSRLTGTKQGKSLAAGTLTSWAGNLRRAEKCRERCIRLGANMTTPSASMDCGNSLFPFK